jgi:mevalonate kinase
MILIGEHAVVYGAKAVAMPVYGMSIKLDVKVSNQTAIIINDQDLTDRIKPLIEDATSLLRLENLDYHIQGESNLPLGAGLGSSAALSVGIIRALTNLAEIKIDESTISKLANKLEERFHGSPSGLDASVVAFDTPIIFQKDAGALQLSAGEDRKGRFKFALIDSQKRSSTKDMVQLAAKYFKDEKSGRKLLSKFDEATNELITGLETGAESKVSKAMKEAYKLLDFISVVPNELKQMVDDALSLGCLAVKPTGAGGGGCLLALLPSNDKDESTSINIIENLYSKFGKNNVHGVTL